MFGLLHTDTAQIDNRYDSIQLSVNFSRQMLQIENIAPEYVVKSLFVRIPPACILTKVNHLSIDYKLKITLKVERVA